MLSSGGTVWPSTRTLDAWQAPESLIINTEASCDEQKIEKEMKKFRQRTLSLLHLTRTRYSTLEASHDVPQSRPPHPPSIDPRSRSSGFSPFASPLFDFHLPLLSFDERSPTILIVTRAVEACPAC